MSILLLFATVNAGFIPIPYWNTGDSESLKETLSCDKYMCAPKNITFADGDCSYYQDNTYYLKPCTAKETPNCYARQGMNSTCTPPLNSGLDLPVFLHGAYPGEICRGDADCKYGTCNNSTDLCVGF